MRKKPTQLKKIDGTFRKDRANHHEPMPEPADNLEPPIQLDKLGQKFWDEIAPELHKLGLLTKLDRYSLLFLAQWVSIHQRGIEGVDTDLIHTTEANGECCKPELTAAKQALTLIQTLGARFGLDPVSRSKISVKPPEEKDPIGERYFKRPVAVK